MKTVGGFIDAVIRYFLTGLLVYSGIVHLQNPYLFLDSVLRYGIANAQIATVVAATLPLFHIYVGLGLSLFHGNTAFEAIAASALFFSYFCLITYAWSTGLEIGCGCLGGWSEPINAATVFRSVVLVCLSGLVAFREYRQYKIRSS